TRWEEREGPGALTLRRAGPEGAAQAFAEAAWPIAPPAEGAAARWRRRLARQVRQDLWRVLRRVRGFAPEVRVETCDAADAPAAGATGTPAQAQAQALVRVRAGGRLVRSGAERQVREAAAALLADPALRRRWTAHAARAPRRTVANETNGAR
ncbi:MAG: hypothetical protein AAFU61_14780, partial [Pseudomonadota bacterium]